MVFYWRRLYSINYGIVGKRRISSMDTTTIFTERLPFRNGHFALKFQTCCYFVITPVANGNLIGICVPSRIFEVSEIMRGRNHACTKLETIKIHRSWRLQMTLFAEVVLVTAACPGMVLPPLLSARLYLRKLNSLELNRRAFQYDYL